MVELKQGWDKARTTGLSEEGITYQYYILGETRPVRVTFDSDGLIMGAETIDPQTGRLKIGHMLLSRLNRSWEVEEIDQERFEELCRALCQKKRMMDQE